MLIRGANTAGPHLLVLWVDEQHRAGLTRDELLRLQHYPPHHPLHRGGLFKQPLSQFEEDLSHREWSQGWEYIRGQIQSEPWFQTETKTYWKYSFSTQ